MTLDASEHRRALEALADLKAEQRERYRPAPQPPPTPIEVFAKRLGDARSPYISLDAAWLR